MEKIKNFFKNNRWLLVFICAIPFFNDSYGSYQLIPDWDMDYIKIAVFLFLVSGFIKYKKKPSKLFIVLFVMEMWWLFSTLMNYPLSDTTSYRKLIIDIINALSVSLLIEYFKDDPSSILKGLMLNFELSLYPNLISVFVDLIPHFRHYILGYYALLILWIIPAIVVSLLYMVNEKKYIRGSILIIACIVTSIEVWCATIIASLFGISFVLLFGLLLFKSKKLSKYKIPLMLIFVFVFVANLFVLFVYTGGNYPVIDFIIEKILRRSTTFTGRVPIWQEALNMFKQSPIYGNGFRPSVTIPGGFTAIHSHNQFLQRLNATGAIGLMLFVLFHILLSLKVDSSKNTIQRLIVVSACFGIFLTYITEAYKKFFRFYLVFFIAYHIDEFVINKISGKEELYK